MECTEVKIPSYEDKIMLRVLVYEPQDNTHIRGVIQIAHGMTEHIGRYKELAQYYTDRSYVVIGNDIISHGKSVAVGTGGLDIKDWFDAVKDITRVESYIEDNYPNVPVYLIGFSLGSFLVRSLENLEGYKKHILIGTGCEPSIVLKALKLYISTFFFKSKNTISEQVTDMALGSYRKKFPNHPANYWLLIDEDRQKEYEEDSLVRPALTPEFFEQFLRGMIYANKKLKAPNNSIPTLMLYGENDPVAGFGKGINKVYNAYKKNNKETYIKSYPKYTHDMLHSKDQEKVFADILEFIEG